MFLLASENKVTLKLFIIVILEISQYLRNITMTAVVKIPKRLVGGICAERHYATVLCVIISDVIIGTK